MRITYTILITTVLAACHSGPYLQSSPYFSIPVGSHIVVKQSVTIPAYAGRVYLQNGNVVIAKERDQYHYNCWFLSWKVVATPQFIKPDTFIVTHVQHTDFLVQGLTGIQLAAKGSTAFDLAMGGATATEYTTELSIHSDQQPDIRRIVCSYWGDPSYGQHITLAQIQAALGDIVQIRIKPITQGDYDSEKGK